MRRSVVCWLLVVPRQSKKLKQTKRELRARGWEVGKSARDGVKTIFRMQNPKVLNRMNTCTLKRLLVARAGLLQISLS